jgi:PKD repeat protein
MKKFRLTLLVVSIFLIFGNLPLLKADVIKLHHSQGQAEMPFIHILKNGDLMVIYNEGHHFNSDATLYYRIYSQENQGWTGQMQVVKKAFASSFAQVAEDADGNLHIVYMDGNASTNRDIWYIRYDIEDEKWGSKVRAYESPGLNSTWPRIKIEGDKIYILWTHNYDPLVGLTDLVMIVNDIGGTWPVDKSRRITVSNTGQSASVHNFFDVRDNRVYAVWMDDNHKEGNWQMYYTEGTYNPVKNTCNFLKANHLFPVAAAQYYPALALDDDNNVHIVFSHKLGPFFHAKKSGNTWSKPAAISKRPTSMNLIMFMKYAKGLLHTTWREITSVGQGLYYGRALHTGKWAEPILIGNGMEEPGYPVLDIDEVGDAHVVWSDGDPDHPRHIYYSKVELPGEPPEAFINASAYMGLIPLEIKFGGGHSSDPDGEITDYFWNFGDGTKASGKNITHTYTTKGQYVVTLTVIDNDMRIGTDQAEIAVSSGEPYAGFTASATKGMIPLTVEFDASSSLDVDGTIETYRWEFGDGASATGITAVHTFEIGGTYTVTLEVIDNHGKSDTTTMDIIVYEKPVARFTANPTLGKAPLEVSFDASESSDVDGNIVSYQWDFGDGLTASGKIIKHTFSTPGDFLVVLTVTDNDGYTGTAAEVIRLLEKPLPPVSAAVENFVNKTFFFTDSLNKITWGANTQNDGLFTISHYRIYRKIQGTGDEQYSFTGEVAGSIFEYTDRGFPSQQVAVTYVYVITAVDSDGNESDYSEPAVVKKRS